jgi:rhodanese-related sulfurtransferase
MLKLPFLWWLPVGRVPEISSQEFKRWLDESRPLQVVDARTGLEYHQGTIGKASHAPLTEMPASMERQKLDKNTPVVVLCLSGHRCLPGVRWLRAHGFEAYSLQGGVLAWKKAGYDVEAP